MGDKNGVIQADGIVSLNLGDISATSRSKDTTVNKFNKIIGMIILESIVNGFKIIDFNIESSYDIILDRQTPPFMYELNVKNDLISRSFRQYNIIILRFFIVPMYKL